MFQKEYYVYILASKRNGTLYIGITNNLALRISQHRDGLVSGFTKKYKVYKLVHYDTTDSVEVAILREKQMKKWKRVWKIELIEKMNPSWEDLYYFL